MGEKQPYQGKQLHHEVLEHYRFRAVELHKAGEKVKDIARFFGIHPNSVSRWLVTHRQKGKKALRSRKATGRPPKLTWEEFNGVLSDLKRPATDFGFETPLWTCKRVRHLIHQRTGKRLDPSNVWRWLGKLGLSNKKPEKRAAEQNPRKARRWLKEEWPKILAHARKWQATLYFQDETVVSMVPVIGKTWAKKGKTAVVKLTGKKGGICVSSVITPRGKMLFRIEKGHVVAKTFIDFLEKIRTQHPRRKVIVVTDQARPHIAKDVGKYIKTNEKSFALYYLPSYSPELNPAEHVWGYLKENKLKAHTAMVFGELKHLTINSMRSIQMRPSLVRSFFRLYLT
jgi:transposase